MEETKDEKISVENDNPSHYGGNWDVANFIEAQGLGFILGNVIKYVARANKKGTREQDLKKAIHYLERELKKEKDVD